jgi:hypothetical protein
MTYYSAKKKNEIISFAGKCMELEVIMLNEISQMRKTDFACSLSPLKYRGSEFNPSAAKKKKKRILPLK